MDNENVLTMGILSAVKTNKIVKFAAKWIGLCIIILSEASKF